MAVSNKPRKTEGYNAGRHTEREKQWYAALADVVGYSKAPEYADHIINWRQCRPPDSIMRDWLWDYDAGKWEVEDAIRSKVENKVQRFHKQEHMGFLRRMIKAGHRALDPVEADGDMKQPVILKYLADGVNQGMMLHNQRQPQSEGLSLGGLTINVGTRPPPRKLRQKDVDQALSLQSPEIIEGDFKLLPEMSHANSNG